MSDLKEYIITLKSYDDLEEFYDDMETPGGTLYIPDRAVDVANRRDISRNTHYYLTDEEAELIRQDSRVIAVELLPEQLQMRPRPHWTQSSSSWNKTSTNNSSYYNWGLVEVLADEKINHWGSDCVSTIEKNINLYKSGKNVDVVIVDGHINPSHPEYAINSDGSGGSRINQLNWFQFNSTVWPTNPSSQYVYTPYVDANQIDMTADNDHGAHVAGIAAGNTNGWARDSVIYNINPYSTNVNTINTLYIFDYIRAFHASKTINPETGTVNPTVVNNSWGYNYYLDVIAISEINYRGTVVVSGTPTTDQLRKYGIDTDGQYAYLPARYSALDADIQDAIAENIIVVGSAGNDATKIDVYGGIDYDNYVKIGSTIYYYNRGNSPGSATNVICVGSADSTSNSKISTFTNTGPRIDIYAPGTNIMSSLNGNISYSSVTDARNSNYYKGKLSGTSMAGPQVSGVIATILETYPNFNQYNVLEYIKNTAKKDFIGGDPHWNNVILLLKMDGETNSSDITDKSPSGYQVNNSSNVQISTTISKNGTGSAYFPGTKELTIDHSAELCMSYDNFTLEFWLLIPQGTVGNKAILNKGPWPTINGSSYLILYGSGKNISFNFSTNGSSWAASLNFVNANADDGQWHHYAVIRQNKSSYKLYRDGANVANATIIDNPVVTTQNLYIGSGNNALNKGIFYIENIRFTKNVSRYISNFLPLTSSFNSYENVDTLNDPHYSKVSLLLSMEIIDNATLPIDNSKNNLQITGIGNAALSSSNSVFSKSSLYIDGTESYLKLPSENIFAFGTNDFSIELWVKPVSSGNTTILVLNGTTQTSTVSGSWAITLEADNKIRFNWNYLTTNNYLTSGNAITNNIWTHVAIIRNNSKLSMYINGILSSINSSFTANINYISEFLYIGGAPNLQNYFNGYIDELRITNNFSRYYSNFVPCKIPYTGSFDNNKLYDKYINDVEFLLTVNSNEQNNNLFDSSKNNYQIITQSVNILDNSSKFGTTSAYFSDSQSYMLIGNFDAWKFLYDFTTKYTIDFWIKFQSFDGNNSTPSIFNNIGSNNINNINCYVNADNKLTFQVRNQSGLIVIEGISTNSITVDNQWHFISITMNNSSNSNQLKIYIDGLLNGEFSKTTNSPSTGNPERELVIGTIIENTVSGNFNGYIDDFRITKNVVRYSDSFVIPSFKFSDNLNNQTQVIARYWRVKNIQLNQAATTLDISELQFFGNRGKLTGTLQSSTTPTFGSVSSLNDNNLTTRCYWNKNLVENSEFYLQYTLSSNGIVVGIKQGGYTLNSHIVSFEVEYSIDNKNWNYLCTIDNISYPGDSTLSDPYQIQPYVIDNIRNRDKSDLHHSNNNYLSVKNDRNLNGIIFPQLKNNYRPVTGSVYPRIINKIYKT